MPTTPAKATRLALRAEPAPVSSVDVGDSAESELVGEPDSLSEEEVDTEGVGVDQELDGVGVGVGVSLIVDQLGVVMTVVWTSERVTVL